MFKFKPFSRFALARFSVSKSYVNRGYMQNSLYSRNLSTMRNEASKVLVLGSGGLSIGQAGEFDYSGSQAIKALKEEKVNSILINPNIATIQTEPSLADKVYFLPLTPEYIEYVLRKEKPDGILLTFGGQTALNCGVELYDKGILQKYNVKVLGTPIETLITSEDRDLFAKALKQIDIPVAKSVAVETVDKALESASQIGYPVIVRSAYALGGLGSGFADNEEQLRQLATSSLSLSPQILVEKSMKGWKEIEYEVVRDAEDNCITVCNMENFDPLGVHTGDSIVVAPSQTLSDEEYHMLRTAAIKIVRHVGVVGECNVQYALNPKSLEYAVIEMNARLSRSSALASKATGYPLASVAAKIALGATLPEITNAVTKTTTACFEPSLDYVVTKIPRWDLSKFNHVSRDIGSSMKSVGESMAIGRTFEESLQKAIRQVDSSYSGFQSQEFENLDESLRNPSDRRLFAVGKAMLDENYSVDQIHELTNIDKWFLYKLENIKNTKNALESSGENLDSALLLEAKQRGFSDKQIATAVKSTESNIRKMRKDAGITPFVKRIDTLAGEVPAVTNYLYTTYNAVSDDLTFNDNGVMVLGSGVYRIGSSVEFDWCGVSTIRSLREQGCKTIMLNYNPETVSTDYDEVDRLYFEELSIERVLDIYEKEQASGVVVSVGGQLPQNMALPLWKQGVKILGTNPLMIDSAEDRFKFSKIMDKIGVNQPQWKELTSVQAAKDFASEVGYPCLIRPSYVLSGAAMNIAYTPKDLELFLSRASAVSPDHPVVITKFIQNAREIDIDAVAKDGKVLVHAISEHVENAGVHSGDATLILPSRSITQDTMISLKDITDRVANAFEITGPFNMQIIQEAATANSPESLKIIECNLRASRSFPFVSKVLNTNFIDVATRAMIDSDVPVPQDLMKNGLIGSILPYQAVKVSQFSWTRLAGADPMLGVEMASTGEVASFGRDKFEAFYLATQSLNPFRVPAKDEGILLGGDHLTSDADIIGISQLLQARGNRIFVSSTQMDRIAPILHEHGIEIEGSIEVSSDRRLMNEKFKNDNISMVVQLSKERPGVVTDENYMVRRMAVDLGVPLMNNDKVARLFFESLLKVEGDYGKVGGVKSWDEYLKPSQEENRKNASMKF